MWYRASASVRSYRTHGAVSETAIGLEYMKQPLLLAGRKAGIRLEK
jgi:hypothetical protein